MFNIFNQNDNKDETEWASVKFYITNPGQPPKVSVTLEDYDEVSINSLCCIVSLLGEDFVTVETINVIKNHLMNSENEKTFASIAQKLGEMEAFKIQFKNDQKKAQKRKAEPCIKPSELA
ncbi:MAG: hypothetical protein ABGY11_01835 [Candidatus Thioglobus sp.]